MRCGCPAPETSGCTLADKPFSNLYTYLAEVSGLPRDRAKLATIKTLYGLNAGPDWQIIVAALKKLAVEEDDALHVS